MPPLRFGLQDLLEYNATYSVLICRECQYAIQKSALQSHLLRHKIYRDERQRLLASIAGFSLFEPEQVTLPVIGSPPIHSLPIISGYRCTAAACGNLCATSKRMRRHQSEVHGLSKLSDVEDCARPVKLQTFFRGTKIRYFEVTPVGRQNEQMHNVEEEIKDRSPPSQISAPTSSFPKPLSKSCSIEFDLQPLNYFHHFTTMTSLTFPGPNTYWQTDVVLQALQRPWLMCGLLALSASHMATLANQTEIARGHRERSIQFSQSFEVGRKQPSICIEADKAGERIENILCCIRWAADISAPESEISSTLHSIMENFRNLATFEHDQDEAYAETHLRVTTLSESALLHRLHLLPTRMAEIFGRPDPESIQDVLATLSAINSLIDCCETSFVSFDATTTFSVIVKWLTSISDHFNRMIEIDSTGALIVVAFWAASLVKTAEDCGCWFLGGEAGRIVRIVEERLPVNDCKVRGLIEGLVR